jgi:hypothetical protein
MKKVVAPCFGNFTNGESASSTHWIGGKMGPAAGLDAVEKRKVSNAEKQITTSHSSNLHSKYCSQLPP